MKLPWIENYAGTWSDEEGRTLIIRICDSKTAAVTLLKDQTVMARPWCNGKPALNLRAKYHPDNGPDLVVELGRPGFSLHVNYEYPDSMEPSDSGSLSVAVSRYESDEDLDEFNKLFGAFKRYKRTHNLDYTKLPIRPRNDLTDKGVRFMIKSQDTLDYIEDQSLKFNEIKEQLLLTWALRGPIRIFDGTYDTLWHKLCKPLSIPISEAWFAFNIRTFKGAPPRPGDFDLVVGQVKEGVPSLDTLMGVEVARIKVTREKTQRLRESNKKQTQLDGLMELGFDYVNLLSLVPQMPSIANLEGISRWVDAAPTLDASQVSSRTAKKSTDNNIGIMTVVIGNLVGPDADPADRGSPAEATWVRAPGRQLVIPPRGVALRTYIKRVIEAAYRNCQANAHDLQPPLFLFSCSRCGVAAVGDEYSKKDWPKPDEMLCSTCCITSRS